MQKLTPDDLAEFIRDLESLGRTHGAVIHEDKRIERPMEELQQAAKAKYDRVREDIGPRVN